MSSSPPRGAPQTTFAMHATVSWDACSIRTMTPLPRSGTFASGWMADKRTFKTS